MSEKESSQEAPQALAEERSDANPTTADQAEASPQDTRLLDADGRERPRFLLNFPKDPALDDLVDAYERGNFKYVRANATQLILETKDPEVKRAAEQLRKRIDPDPLVVTMLAIAIGLFSFLVVWAYALHDH